MNEKNKDNNNEIKEYSDEQIIDGVVWGVSEMAKQSGVNMVCVVHKGDRGGVSMSRECYNEQFIVLREALDKDLDFRKVITAAVLDYIEDNPSDEMKIHRKPKEAGKVIPLNKETIN